MKSNPPLPSLLLAACTLLPSTAAAGDAIELVLTGQINEIYSFGTFPCPFCYWRIGDPFVINVLVDSQSRPIESGKGYRILESSITARNQTFTTTTSELILVNTYTRGKIEFLAWLPWDPDSNAEVAVFAIILLRDGALDGIDELNCTNITALINNSPYNHAGVFYPDDESASGPITLTSCQILPCQPWHCPADFNCDGGVDGVDVQAFFERWEAGNSEADVNRDGATGPYDVEFFFLLWESNECSLPPPL